jgi:hypothetical protein
MKIWPFLENDNINKLLFLKESNDSNKEFHQFLSAAQLKKGKYISATHGHSK